MFGNQLKRPAKAREIVMAAIAMSLMFVLTNQHFISPKRAEAESIQSSLTDLSGKIQEIQAKANAKRQELVEIKKKEQERIATTTTVTTNIDLNVTNDKKTANSYPDVTVFIQDITHPMFRLAVNIDSIKHDASMEKDGYQETKFTLVAHGEYSRVLGFLKKLEEVSEKTRQVGLDTIQISVEKGGNDAVSLSLAGSFYRLEEG